MAHPYSNVRRSHQPKATFNQQRADQRYGAPKTPDLRSGPLIADAEKTAMPEDHYIDAPARQISETGKVKK